MTAAKACLVLYGNSVFLAGIRAELEQYPELDLELLNVEAGCPDVTHLLCDRKPCAVLFDLGMDQPIVAIARLRELPRLLMIGVDPSSNEVLVLSSYPVRALAVRDLGHLILEASHLQEWNSQGKQTGQSLRERNPADDSNETIAGLWTDPSQTFTI